MSEKHNGGPEGQQRVEQVAAITPQPGGGIGLLVPSAQLMALPTTASKSPMNGGATVASPLYSPSLLRDPRIFGRGNGSVRTALMLQMQKTYGNRTVQQYYSQSSVRQSTHTAIQRQEHFAPARRASGPAVGVADVTEGQRAVAQQLIQDIQQGGITVAVYVTPTDYRGQRVHQAGEFRGQATQFAKDHRAVGLAGGEVHYETAMPIEQSLPQLLNTLIAAVGTLLHEQGLTPTAQHVSPSAPIRTLAIFTHGLLHGVEAGPRGRWIHQNNELQTWVHNITPYLGPSPQVLLFACSTTGEVPTGVPLAGAMRDALQSELRRQYPHNPNITPNVWGHALPGHTTANVTLSEFHGGSDPGQTSLRSDLGLRLRTHIIQSLGGSVSLLEAISPRQLNAITAQCNHAVAQIMNPRGHEGAQDPINVYFREIPRRGLDAVWQDLISGSTPDLTSLNLTPEATARAAQGLQIFRERYRQHLPSLQAHINSILHPRGGRSDHGGSAGH